MSNVAVATTSQLAADAARELAAAGGNAVDCALAAALRTAAIRSRLMAMSLFRVQASPPQSVVRALLAFP